MSIYDYSDPKIVFQRALDYGIPAGNIRISLNKKKKYEVLNPNTGKWIGFGSMNPPYEDFTKHKDDDRRRLYLARATKIKGDWLNNPYSPNSLSISLLW